MGFFTGRVSFLRFRVDGPAPDLFGPEHLDKLSHHAIGRQQIASKDGTEAGWIAGEDILDTGFDLAKNVVNDTLHFALRVDSRKLPADLLRAYAREELQALAAENPGGRPSARQKRQAREAARERLEMEAQDGRFLRRKAFPLLWDAQSNQVLVGTTSAAARDHAQRLFKDTFGSGLVFLDAGKQAQAGQPADSTNIRPAVFVPGQTEGEVAWVSDPASVNFLGNEFLLWLWFVLEAEGDSIVLPDGSSVTAMLTRTLLLECPRALSGSETIRSAGPTRLPEARRAVQAGKLPRQAGLLLVRHENEYDLTLQAETLAVGGAKLPAGEESEERARLEERVRRLRHLLDTLDLLYGVFLARRLGKDWPKEQDRMQRWLQHDEKARMAG